MKHCPTQKMLTDMMTKAMHKPIFERLRNKIIADVMTFINGDLLISLAYCKSIYNNLLEK